ncbi:hypothetical protein GCM10027062_28090 [Nocardioides hungaricus]
MFAALHLNSEKLLVPQTVVAEVAYAIQKQGGTDQELMFLQAFADGDLALVDLVTQDVTRVIELVDTYRDFPLGTTDASVIAIAERLNVTDIATLDHRHFPNVRPRHTDYLTLLP